MSTSSPTDTTAGGFSAEERAAMKARAAELKAEARRSNPTVEWPNA
jgi:hypothetical protein